MPNRTVERHEGDGRLERMIFASFARWVEQQLGRSTAFVLAILVVVLWAVAGPFFDWSDTWQLVINTGTTIVTFLMVFVIQNTQNRDTAQARRTDPGQQGRPEFADEPGRKVRTRSREDQIGIRRTRLDG